MAAPWMHKNEPFLLHSHATHVACNSAAKLDVGQLVMTLHCELQVNIDLAASEPTCRLESDRASILQLG